MWDLESSDLDPLMWVQVLPSQAATIPASSTSLTLQSEDGDGVHATGLTGGCRECRTLRVGSCVVCLWLMIMVVVPGFSLI